MHSVFTNTLCIRDHFDKPCYRSYSKFTKKPIKENYSPTALKIDLKFIGCFYKQIAGNVYGDWRTHESLLSMTYKLPLFTFKRFLLSVVFHCCLLPEKLCYPNDHF